jgi:hypothetical protein
MTHTTRTPRSDAGSNATRLLSAGVYLQKQFRDDVINELVKNQFRVVPPSYGYDVVTVLAHALAARSLWRKQVAGIIVGWLIDLILFKIGVISDVGGFLLAIGVAWAFAFLRRAATMQALITRLRPAAGVTGNDTCGDFPANRVLTRELAEKIAIEQAGAKDKIFYGGFRPFVGAGLPLEDWSTAELLIPAKPNELAEYLARDGVDDDMDSHGVDGHGVDGAATAPAVKPFTVDEITDYVAARLRADLRDEAPDGERIGHLTVERQKYSRSGQVPGKRRRLGGIRLEAPAPAAGGASGFARDQDRYDSAREYLCIRVGSWDGELVISIFVGFDLRGNTLYSEFYPYLLAPVVSSFHLVDQLPARLTLPLLLRVGWNVTSGAPVTVLRAVARWLRRGAGLARGHRHASAGDVTVDDFSEFRLGRYAVELFDTGARTSVRELAASDWYHVFFQKVDKEKYVKIVERRLIQIVRDFLEEHGVDVSEHDARGSTILDNSTYNITNSGNNNNFNQRGRQTVKSTPNQNGS